MTGGAGRFPNGGQTVTQTHILSKQKVSQVMGIVSQNSGGSELSQLLGITNSKIAIARPNTS
jgi:hypothetical protein